MTLGLTIADTQSHFRGESDSKARKNADCGARRGEKGAGVLRHANFRLARDGRKTSMWYPGVIMKKPYVPGSGPTGRVNTPRRRPNAPRGSTPWEKLLHHGWTEVHTVPELGPCWESDAPRTSDGYRVVDRIRAHRVSYEHYLGPIPDGAIIRHRCDNPPCINPEHLLPGSNAENSTDRMSRNRQALMPNAKLTEHQAREIKGLLAAGQAIKAIARQFGVSRNAIRSIKRGETWKWL